MIYPGLLHCAGRSCRHRLVASLAGLAIMAWTGSAGIAEQVLTVEKLLSDGWEIAGYTGSIDNRSSMILFKHKDKKHLVQCSVLYDVMRAPRTATNCYEVK